MDIATIIGLALGVVFVLFGIGGGEGGMGAIVLFVSPPSALLVVGGTTAAIFVTYPLKDVLGLIGVVRNAFFAIEEPVNDVIALLVKFAERARREGILALEKQMEEVSDVFLKNGIQLAVDGTEPELLKEIMETELRYLDDRHKKGKMMMEAFATLAPAWGMIGTLVGLILMLANLDDPDALGPGMALALITTLYGSLMANLIFSPMAGKLDTRSKEEALIRELMIMGILSIQSGDNPRIVEQKLNSFIAPKMRKLKED